MADLSASAAALAASSCSVVAASCICSCATSVLRLLTSSGASTCIHRCCYCLSAMPILDVLMDPA